MTRMVWFGDVSEDFVSIAHVVKRAQQEALDACRPGVTCAELDAIARNVITEAGYGENFSHSLGHGVGLEIHEFPGVSSKNKDVIMKPGMVITIEPGIYIEGKGGVRIEDMIVITDDGYENLTNRSSCPIYISCA